MARFASISSSSPTPTRLVDPESEGAVKIDGKPQGTNMGYVVLGKGHMSMLPVGAAYKFSAAETCTILIQSIDGSVTAHKWAEFCQQ
jgi:hypothetical protein